MDISTQSFLMKTFQDKQTGSALIAVLILSTLIGLSSLYTLTALRISSDLNISERNSLSARAKANSELIKKTLSGNFPVTAQAYNLTEHTSLSGKVTITRQALTRTNASPPYVLYQGVLKDLGARPAEAVPFVDYNSIFTGAVACHSTIQKNLNLTPSGFKLSKVSSVNGWTCPLNSKSLLQSSISNLFTKEAVIINSGQLAATGYIDIASIVEVTGPLMVIAGGDLRIKELKADALPVTLISATGRIQVDKISGHPALKFIAAGKVSSPILPVLDNTLYPPLLPGVILGITPP